MITIIAVKKFIFAVLGLLSFAMGVIGVIMPLIPGIPFFLFASYCFLKSSKRLENWFKSTKYYEDYVVRFLENKGMTMKEKVRINIVADFFIIVSIIIVDIWAVKIIIFTLGIIKHYYFIKKIPTLPPNQVSDERQSY
ncbi:MULTISPECIES: YbaN family protein [Allobacillus]|uniref:YbaN family protein n=1 Tax=Allobacillus TaxID=1400133 RepID=UPI001FE3D4D5|nr:YbaN family protein [Allobacillus salarius]